MAEENFKQTHFVNLFCNFTAIAMGFVFKIIFNSSNKINLPGLIIL